MPTQRAPLSATEEAFVALVLEEHTALIRQADARRDSRMSVLLKEKAIPDGVPVQVEGRTGDASAMLVYDGPDPVPAADLSSE